MLQKSLKVTKTSCCIVEMQRTDFYMGLMRFTSMYLTTGAWCLCQLFVWFYCYFSPHINNNTLQCYKIQDLALRSSLWKLSLQRELLKAALLYILIACCNVTVSRVCLLASVASDGFSVKHCWRTFLVQVHTYLCRWCKLISFSLTDVRSSVGGVVLTLLIY